MGRARVITRERLKKRSGATARVATRGFALPLDRLDSVSVVLVAAELYVAFVNDGSVGETTVLCVRFLSWWTRCFGHEAPELSALY